MDSPSHVEDQIKQYLLREVLPGEDPNQLQKQTPLMTSGVLDSIATLQLVAFLEEEFGIAVAPHETDSEHLDSIEKIAHLVLEKSR